VVDTVTAQPRTQLGKRAKALRRGGFLPAVLYGENVPSQSIMLTYKDFEKAYQEAGESTLLTLEVAGKKYNVLIHDITHHPLRGTPLHADFYAVRMDKLITATVSLEFFGESTAVKNEGGILVKVIQEIEVEALPQNLPHELRVDITSLSALGAKVLLKDIIPLKGVKIRGDLDAIVALVEAPRSTEELDTLKSAPIAGEIKEVKTEQEEKREAKVAAETKEETSVT